MRAIKKKISTLVSSNKTAYKSSSLNASSRNRQLFCIINALKMSKFPVKPFTSTGHYVGTAVVTLAGTMRDMNGFSDGSTTA